MVMKMILGIHSFLGLAPWCEPSAIVQYLEKYCIIYHLHVYFKHYLFLNTI